MLQAGRTRFRFLMRSLHFFKFTLSFQPHHESGVGSASNRNEYQKMFLGSKARPASKSDNLTVIIEPVV
jgi:hypothetical protein